MRTLRPMKAPAFLISILAIFLCTPLSIYADEYPSLPIESVASKRDKIVFSDYDGNVILIDFWASWCGPCRQSFPWMNKMQTNYVDQGLTVIAINLDSEREAAADFLEEVPTNFLLGFDPEGHTAEKMNVEAMPMSYLVDRQGRLRHRLMGFNTKKKAEHEALIQSLLKETK